MAIGALTHRRASRLFAFLIILVLGVKFTAHAQNPGVSWQAPYNLSNTSTSSIFPAIIADKYGYVHVFWGEDLGGKPVEPPEIENRSNSIVYSYWDGYGWSAPVDLFVSSGGSAFNYPYAAIDSEDRMHVVWQSYQGISFSSVSLNEAIRVKAWHPAKIIAPVRGDGPRIYSSQRWDLLVIYPAWENVDGGSHDGNIYFTRSSDNGETWSIPVKLSNMSSHENANLTHPSLIEDGLGTIHALWYVSESPDWRGSAIYYSRSEDGGNNWSSPQEIGRRTGDERWASMPEIMTLSENEVHITWVCGIDAHRCHRWSKDGGLNWSNINRLFGDMVSLAGWDTLVSDGSGQLYWIMQLRYPDALYYSYWTGREWSGLQIVNNGDLAGGHYLRAVAHNGNQLDLVMVHQDEKEIWYINGISDANIIEPEKRSAFSTESNLNSNSAPKSTEQHNQISLQGTVTPPFPLSTGEVVDPNDNSTGMVLTISILPVIGLIIVIILIRTVFSKQYPSRNS